MWPTTPVVGPWVPVPSPVLRPLLARCLGLAVCKANAARVISTFGLVHYDHDSGGTNTQFADVQYSRSLVNFSLCYCCIMPRATTCVEMDTPCHASLALPGTHAV
jgi:hypothetical protein